MRNVGARSVKESSAGKFLAGVDGSLSFNHEQNMNFVWGVWLSCASQIAPEETIDAQKLFSHAKKQLGIGHFIACLT